MVRLTKYEKLIRDKLPDIIAAKGKALKFHVADDGEYTQKLNEKLVEEANEFVESGDISELADILEVVYALIDLNGTSKEAVEAIRKKKAEEKGAFTKRIILEAADDVDYKKEKKKVLK